MNTQIERKCLICEKGFKANTEHHKFCSDACRKRNFRNKKKENFNTFSDDIFEISSIGDDVVTNIDKVIFRLNTHDDLVGKIEYQNVMFFLHKLKESFQKLDGQNIDTQ